MNVNFEKISELRKVKGFSVTGFCNLIGISRSTLWSWENKKKLPSESNIRKLAKTLDIPISEISDFSEVIPVSENNLKDVVESWLSYTEINNETHQQEINKVLSSIKSLNTKLNQSVVIIKALVESMKTMFYIKDSSLKYLTVNATFLQNLNLSYDYPVLGKSDSDFFPSTESKLNYEQDKKVFQTGEPLLQLEDNIPGSRKTKWGIISKLPVFDSQKKIIGVIGTSIDITDRKKSLEKRKFLELCIDSMAQMIMILRWKDNRFVYVNKKPFEEISGYPVEKMYAKDGWYFGLGALPHPDDRYKFTIGSKLQHKWNETRDFTWRMIRADKKERLIESTQSFIEHDDSIYTITVSRDISDNPQKKTKLDDLFINIINDLSNECNVITWILKVTNSKDIKAQYLSDSFVDITGYEKSYFTGNVNSLVELIHPQYHHLINKWIKGPKIHKDIKFKIITKNSKTLTVQTSIATIQTHDIGKVYYGKLKVIAN
ncbi:MAG TPA: PAS domain-containing protein [Victivallales bacterium]|nr:PAS domain-containing protein [Victivallales bacterium]